MSNNFNVSNMKVNTNAVFQSLDIKDGNANNKIDASIWNAFARQVGGKTIKSSINESNAIRSINAYLKRGGETVKRIICEFLGWDLHKAKQNVSEAEQMLQDAADGKYCSGRWCKPFVPYRLYSLILLA